MSMPLLWPVRMHSDNQLTHDRLADCVAQAVQRPSSWVGSRPLNVTVAVRPEADVLTEHNYRITSSACKSSDRGTVMPSALAVLRLITRS